MRPYIITIKGCDQEFIFGMHANSPKDCKEFARKVYAHLGYVKKVKKFKGEI